MSSLLSLLPVSLAMLFLMSMIIPPTTEPS